MRTSPVERTHGTVVVVRRHVGLYARREYPNACPSCGSDASRITRTRETILSQNTVRDRTCADCGHRFVTLTPRA